MLRYAPKYTGLIILAFLVVSCAPIVSTDAYPTYDPFAPVNGNGTNAGSGPVQNGASLPDQPIPAGPRPTRAPVSVIVQEFDENAVLSAPTPDLPHPIPSPRQSVDTYTVEAGDTLGSIAQAYGISLNSLLEANGMDESSVLSIGMALEIPPRGQRNGSRLVLQDHPRFGAGQQSHGDRLRYRRVPAGV